MSRCGAIAKSHPSLFTIATFMPPCWPSHLGQQKGLNCSRQYPNSDVQLLLVIITLITLSSCSSNPEVLRYYRLKQWDIFCFFLRLIDRSVWIPHLLCVHSYRSQTHKYHHVKILIIVIILAFCMPEWLLNLNTSLFRGILVVSSYAFACFM